MVTVREICEDEADYWNEGISRFRNVHPLNYFGWGHVRGVDGWRPIYLVAERGGAFKGGLMLLVKKIPYTPYTIFYGQRGPVWDLEDQEVIEGLIKGASKLARRERAVFLRIDPNITEECLNDLGDPFSSMGFIHLERRWSPWNCPRDVSRIDLSRWDNLDDYHRYLHRDTRRCIRKAAKEGVTIEAAETYEELRAFYNIFSAFSVGKGFFVRGFEYQKRLWDVYIRSGNGRLFLAKYKGKIIGGLICIAFGNKCLAMHMGTPYKYHKLQTYYAYVWEAIKWAKDKGCEWFSFRGVGTTPSQEYFKNKFKPDIVALAGYYDLPFKRFLYRIFCFCEFKLLPSLWPFIIRTRKLLSFKKTTDYKRVDGEVKT